MSISEEEHDAISSLTKSLGVSVAKMMHYAKSFGYALELPEHFCAYENDDAEELVIRMNSCSISIKVTIQDKDYAKDRIAEDDISERIDQVIKRIFKENNDGK